MLIRTTRGDVEVRNLFETASQIPRWGSGWTTWSGETVNRETLGGVPAAGAAIRLVGETCGMIPLFVYRGDPLDREQARDSWQWRLLHDEPNPDQSPHEFKQDIASSIEADGNAYIWKTKSMGQVIRANVVDPAIVTVRRNDAGRKVFDIHESGRTRTVGPQTILHIRGWTIQPGADVGLSPIAYHRQALGSAIAIHEFEGRFFRNNATPGGTIEVPGDIDPDTMELYRQQWLEKHSGLTNAHLPAVLKNGAKWTSMGMTLEDAQFIESKGYSVEEICRIFRISSPTLLGMVGQGTVNQSAAEDFERFLKLDLAPRLSRIEQAFLRDPDFFPSRSGLFPEFLADAVLRPDVKTRYEAYRLARQGGWLAPNEIRAKENLPPKDGGDEIQETPVGGAPNSSSDSGGAVPASS